MAHAQCLLIRSIKLSLPFNTIATIALNLEACSAILISALRLQENHSCNKDGYGNYAIKHFVNLELEKKFFLGNVLILRLVICLAYAWERHTYFLCHAKRHFDVFLSTDSPTSENIERLVI